MREPDREAQGAVGRIWVTAAEGVFLGEILKRGWRGSPELRGALGFLPPLCIPSGRGCDGAGSWYTLVSPAASKLFLATSESARALWPPYFSVPSVLFHKTMSAAVSGCSPRAHKEHLASVLLHADFFFGKRVNVGVITFMNH